MKDALKKMTKEELIEELAAAGVPTGDLANETRESILADAMMMVEDIETVIGENPMKRETAQQVGTRVGRAIAHDVLADGQSRKWTGLDAQDGDQFQAAGLEPDTAEWDLAAAAARRAYEQVIRSA